jgi:hypothetical protein
VRTSAIRKAQVRAGDEVLDSSRNEAFSGRRLANNARRNMDSNSAYI